MASDETNAGFLSRWSRRKTQVREGRMQEENPSSAALPTAVGLRPGMSVPGTLEPPLESTPDPQSGPTLVDVQQLTATSDYSAFMSQNVASDVKNAAMKKLFADPHFNVMDGMDVYVDDYSQADPLPLAMLRQMASVNFLNAMKEEPTSSPSQPICAEPNSPKIPEANGSGDL